MDPRTSAKVTAPDLLEAFTEGTGRPLEAVPDLKVFILYSVSGEVTSIEEFGFDALDAVMGVVKAHLSKGDHHAVMVVVAAEEPSIVKKTRKAISAADE